MAALISLNMVVCSGVSKDSGSALWMACILLEEVLSRKRIFRSAAWLMYSNSRAVGIGVVAGFCVVGFGAVVVGVISVFGLFLGVGFVFIFLAFGLFFCVFLGAGFGSGVRGS